MQIQNLIRACNIIGVGGHYFSFLYDYIFWLTVVICDLVQDVETIIHIVNCKQQLEIFSEI